ncbi:hypothetical protein MauCBS54593_005970 [Microsporum audouinii]
MDHGVVEMSLFNEVTISKDENSVVIGVGAQQGEVFQLLGTKCLAVGLTLGEVIRVRLVYAKAPGNKTKWLKRWSSFKPIWVFWNTCEVRTLKDTCDELDKASIKNKRQNFGTMAIKNNLTTLNVVYDSYKETITSKAINIKGMF